jgi:hypothetical protein
VDDKELAFNKRLGHCPAAPGKNPREGLTRHAHALGRSVLVKQLAVRESDGLEFIDADRHGGQVTRGYAERPEAAAWSAAADPTGSKWTPHDL